MEIKGIGAVDILARKPGQTIAVEVETGKSNIKENLDKINHAGFDRFILFAISLMGITPCKKTIDSNSSN